MRCVGSVPRERENSGSTRAGGSAATPHGGASSRRPGAPATHPRSPDASDLAAVRALPRGRTGPPDGGRPVLRRRRALRRARARRVRRARRSRLRRVGGPDPRREPPRAQLVRRPVGPARVPRHARGLGNRARGSRRRRRALPALQPGGRVADQGPGRAGRARARTITAPTCGPRSSPWSSGCGRRPCWSRTCPTFRAGTTAPSSSASTSRCARSGTASRHGSWTGSGTACRSTGSG